MVKILKHEEVRGPGHIFVARVRSAPSGVGNKNPKSLNFFPLDQKKSHQVGSKNTQVKDG